MGKKLYRCLSAVFRRLSVCLFVVSVSALSFAQQHVAEVTCGSETAYYEDFVEAFDKANSAKGSTIRLLGDVTFDGHCPLLTVKTDMTIDINGYCLGDTITATSLLVVNADSVKLTLTSSREGGRIRALRNYNDRIDVLSLWHGEALIENLSLECRNTGVYDENFTNLSVYVIGVGSTASLVMRNCQLTARCERNVSCVTGNGSVNSSARIVLENCTLSAEGKNNIYGLNVYSDLRISSCDLDVKAYDGQTYAMNINHYYDTINHASVTAHLEDMKIRVVSGGDACGIHTKGKTVLNRDTIIAISGNTNAYAVSSSNSITVDSSMLRAEAAYNNSHAIYITQDTASLVVTHTHLSGEAGGTNASAINLYKGVLSAYDCVLDAVVRQDTATVLAYVGCTAVRQSSSESEAVIRRCDLRSRATKELCAQGPIGVTLSGKMQIDSCDISVSCACDHAQGVYMNPKAELQIENTTITSSAVKYAMGLQGAGNADDAASLFMRNCRIQAEGETYSYGINTYSRLDVADSYISVNAAVEKAQGVYCNNYIDNTLNIKAEASLANLRIKCKAGNEAYGVNSRAVIHLYNDTIETVSEGNKAYGFYIDNDASVKRSKISTSASERTAYSVYMTGKHILVRADSCEISALAGDIYASGVNDYKGTFAAADCQISSVVRQDTATVIADSQVNGIAVQSDGNIQLLRCNVYSEATNWKYSRYIYGIYQNGSAEMDSCDITAIGTMNNAYTLRVFNSNKRTTLRDCRLKARANGDCGVIWKNSAAVGKFLLYGGCYSDSRNLKMYLPSDTCDVYRLTEGKDYEEGYYYTIRSIADPQVNIVDVCRQEERIGSYKHICEALEYANQHPDDTLTIVVTGACVLPEGNHILPRNATLLVPYYERQTLPCGTKPSRATNYPNPQEYMRLTLASGAQLVVAGTVEVSAQQSMTNQGHGDVAGGYGRLHLSQGSKIILNARSSLQAWGYVTGEGEIEALPGAEVREFLQFGDWKGGKVTYSMVGNIERIFPVTDYFCQNVECPITFRAGARAYAATAIQVDVMGLRCNDIRFIGDSAALFLLRPNSDGQINRHYDITTDRIYYNVKGNIALGELNITMPAGDFGDISLHSSHYVLPLPSNMSINCEMGTFSMSHDILLRPGTEIRVDPSGRILIPDNTNMYLYDKEQWGKFAGKSYCTVGYSPSWTECPRATKPQSAHLQVEGEVDVYGGLLTTQGGADIMCVDGQAGRIIIRHANPGTSSLYQVTGNTDSWNYTNSAVMSALLRNADGSATQSAYALSGDVFVYEDGQWISRRDDGCIVRTINGNGVEVEAPIETDNGAKIHENPDHGLLAEIDNDFHIFVYDSLCRFVEVTRVNDAYCVMTDSLKVTYTFSDSLGYFVSRAEQRKYTITFLNYNGDILYRIPVAYGVMPVYASAEPRREADSEFVYTFIGWEPELTIVTGDATYTAVYQTSPNLNGLEEVNGTSGGNKKAVIIDGILYLVLPDGSLCTPAGATR